MTMHRLKEVLIAVLVASSTLGGTVAAVQASALDSIRAVGKSKNDAARSSQVKIDKLADETRDLLSDYKTVNKQVDGLKVYNARLQRQIDNQVARITKFDASIDQVTIVSRQMTPLIIRMIDGLEKFVVNRFLFCVHRITAAYHGARAARKQKTERFRALNL